MTKVIWSAIALMALVACKGGTEMDSPTNDSSTEDSDSAVELPPLTAELMVSASFRSGLGFAGYAVAGTPEGVLTHKPSQEAVYLVSWGAGQGVVIEDVAATVATSPFCCDALQSEGSVVTLGGGIMGGGFSSVWPSGIAGVNDATLEDAPFTVTGTLDGGYTGKSYLGDFDGDGDEDIALMEGQVPGNVRVFASWRSHLGAYTADQADITIEACADSVGYGPTFATIFGDDLIAVGCASRNYSAGLIYIFSWPLTSGAEPLRILSDGGGWFGSSQGLGHPLYLDVRGGGALGVIAPAGEEITYLAPTGSSVRFGASPQLAESGGRWYLVVGDQGFDADSDSDVEGTTWICDVTGEEIPSSSWFEDCLQLTTPQDAGLQYMGAAVDVDSDAADIYVSSSGWQYGGQGRGYGIAGWRVSR